MNNWVLSAQEAAAAMDGRLEIYSGEKVIDIEFYGIGTDTREDLSRYLFFALKGDTYDAHDFINAAVKSGAQGIVSHREFTESELQTLRTHSQDTGKPIAHILVADTLSALQALARFWRHKCRAMVLGITGTNGKTSTKEFTAALLSTRMKVQWSKGSFNNHWGVPLSLLSISPEHDVAVIEMGMNHFGELKTLSKIVDANAVVCTMVGRGHLEGVGSIEGVAKAKSEIYEYAPANATFIFNLNNEYTAKMMGQVTDEGRRTLTFSEILNGGSESIGDVSFQVIAETQHSISIRGTIKGVPGEAVVPIYGRHNVTNLMAAASLSLVAGLSAQEIWSALPSCRSIWGRNQWVNLKSGASALFDGYNANPESMRVSIENAAILRKEKNRVIAVLGEMRELGAETSILHHQLGEWVGKAGFDEVIFFGSSERDFLQGYILAKGSAARIRHSPNIERLFAQELKARLQPGDVLLIKGSRGVGLEDFLNQLEPIDFS